MSYVFARIEQKKYQTIFDDIVVMSLRIKTGIRSIKKYTYNIVSTGRGTNMWSGYHTGTMPLSL
jgi:hypothetical protein